MNKSDSEENEEDGADSESTDAETPDRKGSASEDSDMAVFSDDEPLVIISSSSLPFLENIRISIIVNR